MQIAAPAIDDDGLRIGQVSDTFCVTQKTLRFYEEMGLLNPLRRRRERVYSSRDLNRLQIVLRGKRLGFSLRQIDGLLQSFLADERREPADLETLLTASAVQAQLQKLERQRAEVQGAINELSLRIEDDPDPGLERFAPPLRPSAYEAA